jgi:hypothetical protein
VLYEIIKIVISNESIEVRERVKHTRVIIPNWVILQIYLYFLILDVSMGRLRKGKIKVNDLAKKLGLNITVFLLKKMVSIS